MYLYIYIYIYIYPSIYLSIYMNIHIYLYFNPQRARRATFWLISSGRPC